MSDSNTPDKHVRQRVSAGAPKVPTLARRAVMNDIIKRLLQEDLTQGQALKLLRINVLGLKQDAYATLTGISRKTLSEVENDKGNYSSEVINKIFRPFGLRTGLVPVSPHLLASLFARGDHDSDR